MAGITPDPTLRVFVLPLSRRRSARIQVPRDIDDAGWDQMMAVMDAMNQASSPVANQMTARTRRVHHDARTAREHIADVQDGLELRHVRPADLRGQDVNAQMLTPALDEALRRNVAERGALESVPFCALTARGLEIVSGHHRVAAALEAEIDSIPVLVDTTGLDRSSIAAKQLAHNAIAGVSDPQVLAIIAAEISRSDDLMESAVSSLALPPLPAPDLPAASPSVLIPPQYETLTIALLRTELRDFTDLLVEIEAADPADLVVLAPDETWDAFNEALAAAGLRVRSHQATTQLAWLVTQGLAALAKS